MLGSQQFSGLVVAFDEGFSEAGDDGFPHAPKGVDAANHHCADTDVADLCRPYGVEAVDQAPFNRPTVNESVHGNQQAKTEHATKENERSNANTDDVSNRKQGNGEVHACVKPC